MQISCSRKYVEPFSGKNVCRSDVINAPYLMSSLEVLMTLQAKGLHYSKAAFSLTQVFQPII